MKLIRKQNASPNKWRVDETPSPMKMSGTSSPIKSNVDDNSPAKSMQTPQKEPPKKKKKPKKTRSKPNSASDDLTYQQQKNPGTSLSDSEPLRTKIIDVVIRL